MKTAPILVALFGPAVAEGAHDHHHVAAKTSADTPATRAFREADARMHAEMAIRYTGDVEIDFVRGMIPHHRGAAMASA